MRSFELLSPWSLLWGLLAIPLILLYILKVRRKRKVLPSVWLWGSAKRDLLARSPFRRLIWQVPLLLQLLILAVLAFGLAQPASSTDALVGDHVAIVIDVSASMSGKEADGTPRVELAKAVARDLVEALPAGSEALVLEAGRHARLVAPLDRDVERIKDAIDDVVARDEEGEIEPALALAIDRLRSSGGTTKVVFITDGHWAREPSLETLPVPVEVVRVGEARDNAGLVRVDIRTGRDPASDREQVQAFVLASNFGAEAREAYVTMRLENTTDVLDSRRIRLEPGASEPIVLGFEPARGDYEKGLVFELAPGDAMSVDDTAFGRVPAGDALPVIVASDEDRGGWFIRALEADSKVAVSRLGLAALQASDGVPPNALVVVIGACPDNPPGGSLVIVDPPEGECHGAIAKKLEEPPLVTSWSDTDPRMRFLSFDGVFVRSAKMLEVQSEPQRLLNARQGVLIADGSSVARTVTVLGFDVADSNWPLRASFVLFVRNLLEQARAERAFGVAGPARVGEPLRISLPYGATDVESTGPDGEPVVGSERGGLLVVPEVASAGFYRFAWQGRSPGALVVPVNLTSPAESDIREVFEPKEGDPVMRAHDADEAADAFSSWEYWLALAALLLLLFELWWLTRPAPTVSLAGLKPPQTDRDEKAQAPKRAPAETSA